MTAMSRPARVQVPSAARGAIKVFDPRELETEKGFMDAIMKLAVIRHWKVPGRDTTLPLDGLTFHATIAYRSEPGWPDLVMVRRKDRRLIFAELKIDKKTSVLKPRQAQVLELLQDALAWEPAARIRVDGRLIPMIQVFEWRPSNWPEIERVLE